MNKTDLIAYVNTNINTNGVNGITGAEMNTALIGMIDEMDEYTEVNLTDTQIKSLNWNTGLEILPALGVNQYYSKLQILAEFTEGATPYAMSDGSKWLDFFFNDGDNFIDVALISGSDRVCFIDLPIIKTLTIEDSGNNNTTLAPFRDLSQLQGSLELYFGTLNDAEITLGDGTLLLKIWYKIETFGTNL